jgi:hypothetical protein
VKDRWLHVNDELLAWRLAAAPACSGRDPTDDKFLECAVSGHADYVVSADADLLSLREVRGIPILDAPTFWRRLHSDHTDAGAGAPGSRGALRR